MPKSSNQKLKLIYLMKILLERTDETHSITMPEMIDALAAYGISAERKSLYNDIENLRVYGLDIIGIQEDRTYSYHIGNRQFELAELKLLVDSVQSAKFITVKKSNELIKKIEGLASKYEASQLHRQVFVAGRVKTMNESIYYNVDRIHTAIAENSRITFQYFQWNVDKKIELRHDGALYEVSPWALSWDDENYYLIAYDSSERMIKHFRVDKMLDIQSNGRGREGRQAFKAFDMAAYARKMFGMYGGKEELVRIECDNSFAGVMIDRFGKDVSMIRLDDERFVVNVEVAVSRQFLAWIIGLGDGVTLTGPENVVEMMNAEIDRLIRQYKKQEQKFDLQGVFMGHLGLYNENQIRDKLLLVLIFLRIHDLARARTQYWRCLWEQMLYTT